MSESIRQVNAAQMKKISYDIPAFKVGDTVVVKRIIQEGNRRRLQAFEGVVIARNRRDSNFNASFTVRKTVHGGVECVFPLRSPMIDSIHVKRRGKVRRGKLYYIRLLKGRKARIPEKLVHRKRQSS